MEEHVQKVVLGRLDEQLQEVIVPLAEALSAAEQKLAADLAHVRKVGWHFLA